MADKPSAIDGLRESVYSRIEPMGFSRCPTLALGKYPTTDKPSVQVLCPGVSQGVIRPKPGGMVHRLVTFQILVLYPIKAGSNDDQFAAIERLMEQTDDLLQTQASDNFQPFVHYLNFVDSNYQIQGGTHLLGTLTYTTQVYRAVSANA